MPNVNFWLKDSLYSKYVELPFEKKQKLKKHWRKMIIKYINNVGVQNAEQ
jgi:hypothetical protein